MKRFLITGVTGNIGSGLLPFFIKNKVKVFCLIRSKGNLEAKDRLKEAIGEKLDLVEIIPGSINEPQCGISEQDLNLLKTNVDCILHIAASVRFDKEKEQEIREVNLDGTRNIINLAMEIQAKEFHHVSTAYVAGDADVFNEEDFDKGQIPRNPYEKTKKEAEGLVKRCGIPFSIYRPSVVTGNSETGAINSFDGFYGLPKVLWRIKRELKKSFLKRLKARRFFKLDKSGDLIFPVNIKCPDSATLNIIPLNWLAKNMEKLIMTPAQNKTYNLVDENPKQVKWLFGQVLPMIGVNGVTLSNDETTIFPQKIDFLNKIFDMLGPYMRHETEFGISNLKNAIGDDYQPVKIDEEYIKKIMDFAIKKDFKRRVI